MKLKFIKGPSYGVYNRDLVLSQSDYLSTKMRRELKANCGINQRGHAFLGSNTFISIKDLKQLCDYNEHKNKIVETYKNQEDNNYKVDISIDKDGIKTNRR